MKKTIKEKMIAATLALIMSASPVWGVAFAADEAAAENPQTVVSEEVAQTEEEEARRKRLWQKLLQRRHLRQRLLR